MSDLPKGITRISKDNWAGDLAKKLAKPKRAKRKQRKHQDGPQPKFKLSPWRVFKSWLTGRQHQYQLTIRYNFEQDEHGLWPDGKYISRTVLVGLPDPSILGYRHALHKELAPALIKSIPRQYLRNGLIQIQNINFLGVW